MRKSILLFALCCHVLLSQAQSRTDAMLRNLINSGAAPALKHILQYPDSFRYQLIYTQIDRDAHNVPHFKNYYLHVDANMYFNPASTVKLPIALLALEKLHTLSAQGLTGNTPMLTDSSWSGQVKVYTDSTAENNLPSIYHYIKRIFLISDNDAYNRLYEFVGQRAIHEKLRGKGYKDVRIVRRFMPLSEEENRHTNAIRFEDKGKVIYAQPPAYNTQQFNFSRQIFMGKGHLDKNDRLLMTPMDFTRHNSFPLQDLQQMLQSVMFPATVPASRKFDMAKEDYRFLYQYMSEYPSESIYPRYDTAEYFDSYTKFFLFKGAGHNIPGNIRVFNKTGWSYGFLTDAAYIVDFEHNVEFMLTGTIYVNRDGILNDNKYDYEDDGYPFFRDIGRIIYNYELKRKRRHVPDLSEFRLEYHKP
ncbi:MAG TPA: serine hydrolase [Chitinophaga sp.]|uniref:serine hydrolase n=1 Tax=Chitinophaga sp. TaxID=1869181 RepID=UPI002BF761A6|nr:serine hydrolase [Chitinophaga sp.]HVI48872.1 serine hydrolase [Chitinophaga sp.]